MKEISIIDLIMIKRAFKKALKISSKNVKFISEFKGGMSNRNYLFNAENKKYVVHISAKGYDLFVNRCDEVDAFKILKDITCVQKPVYLSEKVRIFSYVDGETMSSINYKEHLEDISKSFHVLHSLPLLKTSYNPFLYLENISKDINEDFDDLFIESWEVLSKDREMLEKRPLCFCHNDLQPNNLVIDSNNNVTILDFEFAKNNDELFDLATFGNLDFNDSLNLLKVYKPDYTREELKILKLYRILVNCQWYLVALRKHELGYDKKLNMNFKDISMFFLSKNRDIIDSL